MQLEDQRESRRELAGTVHSGHKGPPEAEPEPSCLASSFPLFPTTEDLINAAGTQTAVGHEVPGSPTKVFFFLPHTSTSWLCLEQHLPASEATAESSTCYSIRFT